MVKVKGTSGCGQGAMEGGRRGRALGANVRFLASIQSEMGATGEV